MWLSFLPHDLYIVAEFASLKDGLDLDLGRDLFLVDAYERE